MTTTNPTSGNDIGLPEMHNIAAETAEFLSWADTLDPEARYVLLHCMRLANAAKSKGWRRRRLNDFARYMEGRTRSA